MKVILDTNFLIYCAKNKLDYIKELEDLINEGFELVVPVHVVNELNRLKEDKWKKVSGKDKFCADLALKLLLHNKIRIVKAEGKSVDEAIINLANLDSNNIVCTLDRKMRKILKKVILVNRFKRLIIT